MKWVVVVMFGCVHNNNRSNIYSAPPTALMSVLLLAHSIGICFPWSQATYPKKYEVYKYTGGATSTMLYIYLCFLALSFFLFSSLCVSPPPSPVRSFPANGLPFASPCATICCLNHFSTPPLLQHTNSSSTKNKSACSRAYCVYFRSLQSIHHFQQFGKESAQITTPHGLLEKALSPNPDR